MKSFRSLYRFAFILVIFLTFLIGGSIQYLLGVPNIIITLTILGIIYLTYAIYLIYRPRILMNKVVFWAFLFTSVILVSAFINGTNPIKVGFYLIFPLLPLGVFIFLYINYKENIISPRDIFRMALYIAMIQLPVLLVQKFFYYPLILLNNTGQRIADFDFLFGTFFVKSDHSLSLFLLLVIAKIMLNKHLVKNPFFIIFYLSVTMFIAQSNISKLFLVIFLLTAFLVPLYRRNKNKMRFKLLALGFTVLIVSVGYNLRSQEWVRDLLGGSFERQFSLDKSMRQYDLGKAKRFQIAVVVLNEIPLKIVGDGPYSYFNVLTGRFTHNKHFSQVIWTYFDLGIIGLLVLIGFVLSLIYKLNLPRGIPTILMILLVAAYTVYTTIFSDIAIVLSLMLIFNRNYSESYSYSLPRLEKE